MTRRWRPTLLKEVIGFRRCLFTAVAEAAAEAAASLFTDWPAAVVSAGHSARLKRQTSLISLITHTRVMRDEPLSPLSQVGCQSVGRRGKKQHFHKPPGNEGARPQVTRVQREKDARSVYA